VAKAKKPKTSAREKLKKFQKKAGLDVTGNYDSVTRKNLKLARAKKPLQTPSARKKRRADRAKAKLNEPISTAPLTEKTLGDEIKAQTNLRFGGQERQIGDEQRVSTEMRDRRIPAYYQSYLQQVQSAQMGQKAQTDQAIGQVNAMADKDAAPAGASPEAVQAAQARQALTRSYGGMLTAQGQNQQNQYFNQQNVTHLRQQQGQMEEDNRQANLRAKLLELEGQKGDFATGLRTQARSSERNYALQNAALGQKADAEAADQKIANARLRNDKALAASLIGDRKSDNKRQAKRDRTEAQYKREMAKMNRKKFASAEAKDSYQRKNQLGPYKPASKGKGGSGGSGGGKSGGGGPTRPQKISAQNNYSKALQLLRGSFAASGKNPKKRGSYYSALIAKGIPADLAQAAVQHGLDGGVDPKLARTLHRRYRLKNVKVRGRRSNIAPGANGQRRPT
jgi:hypothetical protein